MKVLAMCFCWFFCQQFNTQKNQSSPMPKRAQRKNVRKRKTFEEEFDEAPPAAPKAKKQKKTQTPTPPDSPFMSALEAFLRDGECEQQELELNAAREKMRQAQTNTRKARAALNHAAAELFDQNSSHTGPSDDWYGDDGDEFVYRASHTRRKR
jgi:type IV secretory pathway VirB10-like protein